ncbi:MAG: hypothetical protein IKT40_08825 [Bacilli bacterium]|nr:hypothetical protein [Bacilli bacterium]
MENNDNKITLEVRKAIAKIINEHGSDYLTNIRYVEFNDKYWIIWVKRFVMYCDVKDKFSTLKGITSLDIEEIKEFLEYFSK